MLNKLGVVALPVLLIAFIMSSTSLAWEGYNGYEGGISSGYKEGQKVLTMDYKEVCFITGEPIILKGDLTIKKSLKQDTIASTYTYKLSNDDSSVTLTRVLLFNTELTKKDNGQTIEETTLNSKSKPVEVIKIDSDTYTLKSYDYTRTKIIDPKPAIDYYRGNLRGLKTYQIGTNGSDGSVTIEMTGDTYGYDQFWGTSEVQELKYYVDIVRKQDKSEYKWGGNADIVIASNMNKSFEYYNNEPDQISFDGGYILTQDNASVMKYDAKFPEIDQNGIPTNNIVEYSDSMEIDGFPIQTMLGVPNLNHLRGYWYENDVKILYSLNVLKEDSTEFNPQQYITRAEFASAIAEAAKQAPTDPYLSSKTTTTRTSSRRNQVVEVSPFIDVAVSDRYYSQIKAAYQRGLIAGRGEDKFSPDEYLTVADALTVFVRALGLEGLAPNPVAVTTFKDNDKIPGYARNAAYVSQRIGLIKGDDKGYLYPNDNLTKARAAALINRFINYMREGIIKDYRERALNF